MTSHLVRLVVFGRVALIEFLVCRVWPLGLAWYCAVLAASPSYRSIYGFNSHLLADVSLGLTAALLVASACRPDDLRVGTVAMALATWTLMGRASSFAFQGEAFSPMANPWPNVIGASIYVVLTLAEVTLHLVQTAIAIDRRARG